MRYEFRIDMGGNAMQMLSQFSQQYSQSFSQWERLSSRFAGLFGQRFQSMFRRSSQSVDELRRKLDGLKGTRDLMVDTRQIRRANQEIQQLEGRLNRLQNLGARNNSGGSGGGNWLGGLARNALPALGIAGLVAGAGSALSSGMSREQTQMAFQQFLKTPEATKQVFGQLNKFADKTPYTNEQVYGAGRSLLAAGFDKTQIMPKMNTLGNVAAGVQTDFEDLVGIYGKSKQKGFADTSDIWQYTDRKIPILDALSKVTGKDNPTLLKMAEKRQISMDLIDKAFESMGNNGGQFDGMLEKLSSTAGGKLSTLTGSMGNKIAEWAATQNSALGKAFDFGTEFITKMGPIEEAVGRLFGAFSPLIDSLKKVFGLFGMISQNGSAMDGIITTLSKSVEFLAIVVSGLTSPLGQFYVAGVAIFTLLGKLPAMIQTVTAAFASNPVTVWIVALGALVVGLKWAYDNLEWFKDGVDRIGSFLMNVFENLGTVLMALVLPTPGNIGAALSAVGKAWEKSAPSGSQSGASSGDRDRYESERDDHTLKPTKKPNFGNVVGAPPSGGGSIGKAAGLESAVSGAKSTSITINLKSLNEGGIHVHTANLGQSVSEIETIMMDTLLRVLNSSNSMAS